MRIGNLDHQIDYLELQHIHPEKKKLTKGHDIMNTPSVTKNTQPTTINKLKSLTFEFVDRFGGRMGLLIG